MTTPLMRDLERMSMVLRLREAITALLEDPQDEKAQELARIALEYSENF